MLVTSLIAWVTAGLVRAVELHYLRCSSRRVTLIMATATALSPAVAGGVQQQLSTSRVRRLVIYNLLAGQHLVNYLCRLSIPFV
eukprot:COSAG02_NODE_9516_length_2190_cov_3.307987_1_plen_83_part_10